MLRSQTVNTIHDSHAQGKSVQEIAQELSISRTTVRKYLKHPEAVIPKPRPPRPSKLDPSKEQIKKWVMEDHCTNCEVLFERLQKLKPNRESKCNLTGASLSMSTRGKCINFTGCMLDIIRESDKS